MANQTVNASDNRIVAIVNGSTPIAGSLLEGFTASNTQGIAATSGQNLNIVSIPLPVGYWKVWGNFYFISTSGTSNAYGWISTTSATYPSNTSVTCIPGASTPVAAGPVPMWRMPYNATATTLYLSGQANFSGTGTYYGQIFIERYA